jgi:hypothetical protein
MRADRKEKMRLANNVSLYLSAFVFNIRVDP